MAYAGRGGGGVMRVAVSCEPVRITGNVTELLFWRWLLFCTSDWSMFLGKTGRSLGGGFVVVRQKRACLVRPAAAVKTHNAGYKCLQEGLAVDVQ